MKQHIRQSESVAVTLSDAAPPPPRRGSSSLSQPGAADVPYPTYDEAVRMTYRPAKVGDTFGPSWTTHWFRIRARVPDSWDGLGPLMFRCGPVR